MSLLNKVKSRIIVEERKLRIPDMSNVPEISRKDIKDIIDGCNEVIKLYEPHIVDGQYDGKMIEGNGTYNRNTRSVKQPEPLSTKQFFDTYNSNVEAKKMYEKQLADMDKKPEISKPDIDLGPAPDKKKIQVGKRWTREDLSKWGIGK